MNKIKNNWLFIVGSLTFLAAGILFYDLTTQFIIRYNIMHSNIYYYEELEDTRINLRRAIIGHRDYLLTRDNEYLKYYYTFRGRTLENIDVIYSLEYLKEVDRENIKNMRQDLKGFFIMMDSVAVINSLGQNERINQYVERSYEFYYAISGLGEQIELQLEENLFEQLDKHKNQVKNVRVLFIYGFVVGFLLLLLNYYLLEKEIKRRKKVEVQIREQAAQLEDLNASKDKFFSIIAHDLRSPFNYLLGFSKILKDKASEKAVEEIKKISSIIHDATKNTFNLLENLLKWSEIQAGSFELRSGKFDLIEVASEVSQLFNEFAKEKDIKVVNEIQAGSLTYSDKNVVSTVMRNLLNNAIKFNFPGGIVKIMAVEENHKWILSVQDTGPGIKPEALDLIFRIDKKYTTKGTVNERGSGLGLLLSKELVEKNGGEIWVESKPGEGTTFYFTVPLIKNM